MTSMNNAIPCLLLLTAMFVHGCDKPQPSAGGTQDSLSSNISDGLTRAIGKGQIDSGNTLAIVNGKPITHELLIVYRKLKEMQEGHATDTPISEKESIEELINMQLLVQKAQRENLHRLPEIANLIQLQQDSILAKRAINDMLRGHVADEESINSEYRRQYTGQTQREYSARHILVRELTTAEQLISQLRQGADFAQLAQQHSIGPSAPHGGNLEWFSLDSVLPEFARAVQMLEKNDITATPIQTRYGWHVIQLLDAREIAPPPLQQVRERIIASLQDAYLDQALQQLRSEADIQLLKQRVVE